MENFQDMEIILDMEAKHNTLYIVQQDTWQDHPPFRTSLLTSLSTRLTPHSPLSQPFRRGGVSREDHSRNMGWRVNKGPMAYGRSRRMPSLRSDLDMPTQRPMWKREWIHFYIGGNKWIITSTGEISTINRNNFLRFPSKLMGCWVRGAKL